VPPKQNKTKNPKSSGERKCVLKEIQIYMEFTDTKRQTRPPLEALPRSWSQTDTLLCRPHGCTHYKTHVSTVIFTICTTDISRYLEQQNTLMCYWNKKWIQRPDTGGAVTTC
jgi:hypothetical protein